MADRNTIHLGPSARKRRRVGDGDDFASSDEGHGGHRHQYCELLVMSLPLAIEPCSTRQIEDHISLLQSEVEEYEELVNAKLAEIERAEDRLDYLKSASNDDTPTNTSSLNLKKDLRDIISETVNAKIEDLHGLDNSTLLQSSLREMKKELFGRIDGVNLKDDNSVEYDKNRFRVYRYGQGKWAVPEDFSFPAVPLLSAWIAWLIGFPNNRSTKVTPGGDYVATIAPVRPLRFITADSSMMPKNNRHRVRKVLCDNWRPVLSLMHEATKHLIRKKDIADMNSEFFETTFATARSSLQEKYPRLFEGRNYDKGPRWKVSTWSKKVREENRRMKKEQGQGSFYEPLQGSSSSSYLI